MDSKREVGVLSSVILQHDFEGIRRWIEKTSPEDINSDFKAVTQGREKEVLSLIMGLGKSHLTLFEQLLLQLDEAKEVEQQAIQACIALLINKMDLSVICNEL